MWEAGLKRSLISAARDRLAVAPAPFLFDRRLDALVERLCGDTTSAGRVLNVGAGRTTYGSQVVNLDIERFPGVHVRGDAQRLPFGPSWFRGAILRGVLEHVGDASLVMAEVVRVLRPGGFVYVEVPFIQPLHLSPEDHRRFTLPGLRAFLDEFEETESGVQIGPASALSWVLREAVASLLAFGSASLYRKALALTGWATFWIKYLDRLIVGAPHVAHAASAVYFLGRKRPNA